MILLTSSKILARNLNPSGTVLVIAVKPLTHPHSSCWEGGGGIAGQLTLIGIGAGASCKGEASTY